MRENGTDQLESSCSLTDLTIMQIRGLQFYITL